MIRLRMPNTINAVAQGDFKAVVVDGILTLPDDTSTETINTLITICGAQLYVEDLTPPTEIELELGVLDPSLPTVKKKGRPKKIEEVVF